MLFSRSSPVHWPAELTFRDEKTPSPSPLPLPKPLSVSLRQPTPQLWQQLLRPVPQSDAAIERMQAAERERKQALYNGYALPPELIALLPSVLTARTDQDVEATSTLLLLQGRPPVPNTAFLLPYGGLMQAEDYDAFSPLERALWMGDFRALRNDSLCFPRSHKRKRRPLPTVHTSVLYLVLEHDLARGTALTTAALQRCVAISLLDVAPNLTIQVVAAAMGRHDIVAAAGKAPAVVPTAYDPRLHRFVRPVNAHSQKLASQAAIRMNRILPGGPLELQHAQPLLLGSRFGWIEVLDAFQHLIHQCGSQEEVHAAIDAAAMRGHLHVLAWWKRHRSYFPWTAKTISRVPHTGVLDWFDDNVPSFLNGGFCDALTQYAADGRLDLIEWWRQRRDGKLEPCFPMIRNAFLRAAAQHHRLPVLAWAVQWRAHRTWTESGELLPMPPVVWKVICSERRTEMLEWWRETSAHVRPLQQQTFHSAPLEEALLAAKLLVLRWMAAQQVLDRMVLEHPSLLCGRLVTSNEVGMLIWFQRHSGQPLPCEPAVTEAAARAGAIEGLRWYFRTHRHVPQERVTRSIDAAAAAGQVDVLAFFLHDVPLPFTCTHQALDVASAEGHLAVLQFFWAHRLELQFTAHALDQATLRGDLDVVRWWFEAAGQEVPLAYSHVGLDRASQEGHIAMLDLWYASGYPMRFTTAAVDRSRIWDNEALQLRTLEWWRRSGLAMKYTHLAMDTASIHGRLGVLNWWLYSGKPLLYSKRAMDETTHVAALHWWRHSGLPLKYTAAVTVDHAAAGAAPLVKRDPFGPSSGFIDYRLPSKQPILDWWTASGLRKHLLVETSIPSI